MQQATRDTQYAVRNTPHIAIVGGGIAGLATAYYLQQKARQASRPLTYTLIESRPIFGGKIATIIKDGFVIEGGPDSFITQKPAAVHLCRELGLEERLIGTNDARRKVYVLDGGRLLPLPDGVMLIVPTKFAPFALSPLISLPGKARMGLDLFIPPRRGEDDDESMADFIRRRLGREALDKIAEPLLAGIHVADPERLSMKSAFPRLVELERRHGSLIKGMLAQKSHTQGHGRPQPLFMTLRGGLQELIAALVARLEGQLLPASRVVGLERVADSAIGRHSERSEGSRYRLHLGDGQALLADAVILAIPSYIAADLLEPLHPALAAKVRAIRHVSTATVSLGFQCAGFEHPLGGFGFVVSARAKSRLMACTWTSTKFDGRAPHDYVLLRGFVGGPRNERLVDLPDEALIQLVRDELRQAMGVGARPAVTCVYRWPHGNPQYDVGHLERMDEIESMAAALPGLYLTGSSYRGIGIPDCIEQGRKTAETVIAW
jgi:oxygen-dependent protoporphyrinogen oxidase